jgi:hypothetical protein
VTLPGRRRRPRRALWFVLGIAFGAAAAVAVRGGPAETLGGARAWSATMLRSLESTPPPSKAAPTSAADVASSGAPMLAARNAPCPVEPRPDDPCAALLAPFASRTLVSTASTASTAGTAATAPNVPTIAVDDLPRVRPMPPVANAGHAARPGRRARPAAQASPPREDAPAAEPEVDETPGQGINPDDADPEATPVRAAPGREPPAIKGPADPPSRELPSARNESS